MAPTPMAPTPATPTPSPSLSPPPTPLTIEETERRLQDVTAQLDALPRLPKHLQSELQTLKETLQLIVTRLQQQVIMLLTILRPPKVKRILLTVEIP